MGCSHFPEMDCSLDLGSWMLRECSAALPGHPTLRLPASSPARGFSLPPLPVLPPKQGHRGFPWDAWTDVAVGQGLVPPPDTGDDLPLDASCSTGRTEVLLRLSGTQLEKLMELKCSEPRETGRTKLPGRWQPGRTSGTRKTTKQRWDC